MARGVTGTAAGAGLRRAARLPAPRVLCIPATEGPIVAVLRGGRSA